MSEELNIKIGIQSDTSGASQAASAVERVGKVTTTASHEAKEFSKGLGENAKIGKEAAEVFSHLERASKGGVEGFIGAAQAIKSFTGALRGALAGAGPIGLAIGAASLLGAAYFALKDKFSAAGDSAEKMQDKVEKATETVTKFDKLNLKFADQKKELDELRDKYTQLKAAEDAAFAAAQRVTDAKSGKALADINLKEAKDLRNARTDDQKAEIQARAEAQRTLVQGQAEAEKKAAEQRKATEDLANLQKQQAEEQKKLGELLKTKLQAEVAAAELRVKAYAGGVKSDQQRALDDLAKLRADQAKQELQLAPFKNAGLTSVVDVVEGSSEAIARRQRIAELSRQEPALRDTVAAGKETFTAEAERIKTELEAASKAFKSDANDQNANILNLAKARAELVEKIQKLPEQNKLKDEREKEERDARDALNALNNKITAAKADVEALKIERQTTREKTGASLIKQATSVDEENKKRAQAAIDIENAKADREKALQPINDRLGQVFSNSEEGQALLAQRERLISQPLPSVAPKPLNVPELAKIPGLVGDSFNPAPDAKAVTQGAEQISKSLDKAGEAKPDLKPAVDAAQKFAEGQVQWNSKQSDVLSQQASATGQLANVVVEQQKQQDELKRRLEELSRQILNLRSTK